ncbi:MAG: lytic transglycosylase domain-containing protein [Candidatus Aminicenantes bacterium]|nr:lytic transglycosylase domain-containing protein [Candidatus Aminicenantes bacterium]
MKFINKSPSLKYTLFFVSVFVFSLVAAYCLTQMIHVVDPVHETSVVNRQQLFRNYRILKYFLATDSQIPLAEMDPSDRNKPVLVELAFLKKARDLINEKKYESGEVILAKVNGISPYIAARRDELKLRSLFGQNKNKDFIAYYDRHPATGPELQILLLASLLKNRQMDRAQKEFRRLFLKGNLSPFLKTISRPAMAALLKNLDEDFWLNKLSFLLKNNARTEFTRELPYCRFSSLVRLFKAEFAYRHREYSQCQSFLRGGLGKKYQPFADKLLLKIAVRLDPQTEITERLQAFKRSPFYPQLLLDLAQILAGNDEYDRALPLYSLYLKQGHESGEEYWKTVWRLAWIHYRQDQKGLARHYFRQGSTSPFLSYRIASQYWLNKLEKGPPVPKHAYPYSYYAVKVLQDKARFKHLQQTFVRTIDKPPSARFLEIIADLKLLAKYGLWPECAETAHAFKDDLRLNGSDRNLLKIIESLIYLRQNKFYQAFSKFRGNFKAIESVRLPNFLSDIFFPRRYSQLIATYSREQSVDPCLVHALIREESFFRADSVSPAKAHGLMQLLHGTARALVRKGERKLKVQDLYDPEINIRLGLAYLKTLLEKYDGRLFLALAAYNAGDHRVDQWLRDFPGTGEEEFIEMIPFTETRTYVKNILRNYFFYRYYYDNGKV